MVRARRVRAAEGQQGRIRGLLLCPARGHFLLLAYGSKWTLPADSMLSFRLRRLCQPLEQVPVELTATWHSTPTGGKHSWGVKATGAKAPLTEQLEVWEE